MAQIDLGKLKFNWKGDWASTSAYEADDVIIYKGTTYVVTAIVAQANTTIPPFSGAYEKMAQGLNFTGAYNSSTAYYKGDVVTYLNQTFVLLANSSTGSTPTNGTTWLLLTPAPTGSIMTTSGDMIVRDNDGSTNKRLPIGKLNSRLTVVDAPNEDIPNENNFIYRPLSKSASATDRVFGLYGDNTVTPNNRTLAVTVAAVSGQNQFHIGGVDRPAIQANVGETITFDVSDSSNTGHVFAFKTWAGGSSSNYVAMYLEAQYGITRSGTPGQSGATITWVVNENCYNPMQYYCSAHSAMGTGVINTASTLTPPQPTAYYNPLTSSGSLKISKGKSYTFTFPADGLTYSIKDPSASGYTGAGSGGRIVDGTAQPQSVTNGGSITYTPAANSSLATVVIRNEANQNDVLTLSLTDPASEPAWTDAASTYLKTMPSMETRRKAPYCHFINSDVNTYTEGIQPLPAYLKETGRGQKYGTAANAYRQGGYIDTAGQYHQWGNHYHDGSGYYYGAGIGVGSTIGGSTDIPYRSNFRTPLWWKKALAGDSDYAKFLTDVNGNDLGYLDADGVPQVTIPKIMQIHGGSAKKWFLYENGMVSASGHGADGLLGNGRTDTRYYHLPLKFYDNATSELTGANYPKITQMHASDAHVMDSTTNDFNGCYYFLSTEGKLYRFGYNGYGQLGDNTTTNNYYNREMPMSLFGNEKIIYITGTGYQYNTMYAITESGKLWGWGRNTHGQLGLGNTTDQLVPIELTAVSGSLLENKKVIHVMACQGDDDEGRVYVLTTEGKVLYAGRNLSYGIYSGLYKTSNNSNQADFSELTNASTLWNSNNQKVIYMTMSDSERSTLYFITDGGTTGHSQKVYATGSNSYGRYGAGVSTTHGATASAQGNWFGAEIKFRDFGDLSNGTNNSRPNETTDMTLDSLQTGSNKTKFKVGRITEIHASGYSDEDYGRVLMIDEFGSMFYAGYWYYNLCECLEDDNEDNFTNTNDHVTSFIPVFNQPEPLMPRGYIHSGSVYQENGWIIMSKSGYVYSGGYDGWNQSGTPTGLHGFFHLHQNWNA